MKVEVLESNSGVSKKGNAYTIALLRVNDRVGKVFSDVPLDQFTGETVDVDLQMAPNQEMFLTPRVKSVLAKPK